MNVALTDFLTEAEIKKAVKLYKTAQPGTFAKLCAAQIIEPNMARINAALGQENNAQYLAYAVEFVMGQAVKR